MADIGNLHFGVHLKDYTDTEANAIKKKLENLSVSLKIDGNNVSVVNTDAIKKQIESAVKSVSIPSVSVDANAVKAQIETAVKGTTPQVSVSLIKNNLGKDIQDYLNTKTFDVKISISNQKVQSQLQNLGSVSIKATLKLDRRAAIDSLKKSLQNTSVPVSVRMNSAKDLMADIRQKMKNQSFKIDIDANKVALSSNVKQALKNQTFTANLKLNIQTVDVQQAIRDAFAKAGMSYNTSASNVRAALINTRQQKADAYVDAQKALADLRRAQLASAQAANLQQNAMQGVNKAADRQRSLVTELSDKIANLYSVVQIGQFLANMVRIGGEFEQQKVALSTIIGDAGKANILFERIKGLAVESPFKFGDLAKYSKQLAAFGVEYEDLYDTLKRFGDISAGLGVDMQRIILAFGQVKSAEFLKGTELRQFTEAGIPLVSELARRYTELEGEAVKVGDVFDRISKKEVPFADVKSVLWDLTNEGGRFFEMQAVLTDTLKGKLDKLIDSYEIFLSEIANSNHTAIGGTLDLLAEVLKHWKEIEKAVMAVTVAYGTYKAVLLSVAAAQKTMIKVEMIQKAITSMMFLGKATNTVSGAFKLLGKTLMKNPIGMIAGVMGSLVSIVYGLRYQVDDASQSIDKMNAALQEEIDTINLNKKKSDELVTIFTNEKNSMNAREKAYRQMQTIYPSLFKNMKMEEALLKGELKLRQMITEAAKKETKEKLEESLNQAKIDLAEAKRLQNTQRLMYNRDGSVTDLKSQQQKNQEAANVASIEQQILELEAQIAELDKKAEELSKRQGERWYKDTVKYVESLGDKFKSLLPKDDETREDYFRRIGESVDDLDGKIDNLNKDSEAAKEILDGENGLNKEYSVTKHIYTSILGGKDEDLKKQREEWNKQQKENERKQKEAARKAAQAYVSALKDEISKISSQWDLYKELFEATGNKSLSMNIAFDGMIPNFDDYISHLKGLMQDEIKKRGLGISVVDLLSEGKEGIAKRVNDKSQTAWTDEAAKSLNAIIDSYNNANKKLNEESVKNFLEIIKNSKDFAQQIADIDRELQKDLADLAKNYGGTDSEEYKRRSEELIKKAEEDKNSVRFEEFKKSSDWIKVFDDLDRVSNVTLDAMIQKVEEFARNTNLSVKDTKELVDALRKLRSEAIDRNPLKSLVGSLERLNALRDALKKGKRDDGLYYVKNQGKGGFTGMTKEQIKQLQKEGWSDANISLLEISNKFQKVSQAANVLGDLFYSLGVDVSFATSAINSIASGASTGASIGGGWGAVIGGAIGMLTAAFSSRDSNRDKWIENSQRSLKVIEKYSDRLDKLLNENLGGIYTMRIDDATKKYLSNFADIEKYAGSLDMESSRWLRNNKDLYNNAATSAKDALESDSYFKAQKALLEMERVELERQKHLEEDKKNSNKDKIADYELEIAELEASIKTFAQDMMNTIYGIDFKDWANQFTDSIVDAWSKGEDAADAYKRTVSDVMRNVAASVIQQGIIGKWLEENMANVLDLFSADDGKITDRVYSALADLAIGVGDKIEETETFLEAWEKILNEKDLTMRDSDSSASGSLSKGIQSVTEDTANLLGSYLNSIRQSVHVKQQLIEKLVGDDIPKINFLAEAQLRELSAIQANTAKNVTLVGEIRDLVNRVVDKGSNKIKV